MMSFSNKLMASLLLAPALVLLTVASAGLLSQDDAVRDTPCCASEETTPACSSHPASERPQLRESSRRDVPVQRRPLTEEAPVKVAESFRNRHHRSPDSTPLFLAVMGQVVDEDGRGIAGARIRLAPAMHSCELQTDGSGRFTLRSPFARLQIGVSAVGYQPCPPVRVEGEPGRQAEVKLVLKAGGACLAGRVVHPDGIPVSGAEVRVCPDAPGHQMFSSVARSDRTGHFLIEGLAAGPTVASVRAKGHAPWQTQLELERDGRREVEVLLHPGASVQGIIHDPNGLPAGGAQVTACDSRGKPIESTTTVKDGSFRLSDLGPGPARLEARTRDLCVTHEIELQEGQVSWWEDALAPLPRLSGRLTDARGRPLGDWLIEAGPALDRTASRRRVHTARDGRFQMRTRRGEAWQLAVFDPDLSAHLPAAMETVEPGQREVNLVVPDVGQATAFLTGRIVNRDGTLLTTGVVRARQSQRAVSCRTDVDLESGRFRLGPLPPGDYSVAVQLGPTLSVSLGCCRLTAGENRDLGPVFLDPSGSLWLDWKHGEEMLAFAIYHAEAGAMPRPVVSGRLHGDRNLPLLPGSYRIVLTGSSSAARNLGFTVISDRETRLEIKPIPPVLVRLDLIDRYGSPYSGDVRLRVCDDHQHIVIARVLDHVSGANPPAPLRLAPGRYHLMVTSVRGTKATATFGIDSTEASEISLEVRLAAEGD